VWWIPLVLVISAPWGSFVREPQWRRVHLVPLTDPADRLRDIVANVLLFVPFGYSAAGRRHSRSSFFFALGAAAFVSMSAEALQLFSTSRHPSATDVTAAVIGSSVGAAWRKLVGLM
jgi:VanZ family protein